MKKFLTFALMLLMLFNLASCKKDDKDDNKGNEEVQRTYVVDGQYTAYSINKEATKPEVTLVTVTIKDDKISAVNIDTIQGSVTADGAAFNAQSKKELGYGYHMHWYSYQPAEGEEKTEEGYKAWLKANNKLEWHEQMALVEAQIVANGVAGVTVADGKFTNVAGVSVSAYDYLDLAAEAIQMAKDGKKQAVIAREDDLVVASANVDKDGKLSNVVLDEITGSFNKTDATWAWGHAKQELGYGYHMHWYSYQPAEGEEKTEEGYAAWLKANNKLEWVDQAKLIVEAWVANGSVEYANIAGVTVANHDYLAVLNQLKK